MAATLIPEGVARNPVNGLRVRLGHNRETLAGAKTLVPQDAQFQNLNPNGVARVVTMPDVGASQGLFFLIANIGGADDLTITHAASSLSDTLANDRVSIYACDGSTWVNVSGIITFA